MDISPAEKVRKRIEESNAAFLASSREGKRIMLALDVIYQLSIRRMVPMSVYFDPGDKYFERSGLEVRDVLKEVDTCFVCGIGSFFMAAVERLNEFKFRDFEDDFTTSSRFRGNIVAYLGKHDLFSLAEMLAVEAFFELYNDASQHRSARMWKEEPNNDHTVRLKRIAEVVVRTEGRQELTLDLLMKELPTGEFDPLPVTP
jgi:hypothetical protein